MEIVVMVNACFSKCGQERYLGTWHLNWDPDGVKEPATSEFVENVHFAEKEQQAQRLKQAQQGIFKVIKKVGAARVLNQG